MHLTKLYSPVSSGRFWLANLVNNGEVEGEVEEVASLEFSGGGRIG